MIYYVYTSKRKGLAMTNMIRIDSDHHQKLRLSAFNKHTSIQSELDAILQKHFEEK